MLKKINLSFSLIIQIILFCTLCSCTNTKDFVESKLEEAKTLFKNGEYKKCVKICDNILEKDDKLLLAYITKGHCLLGSQLYHEALNIYDKAIVLNPDFAELYNEKARILYRVKKYQQAIDAYNMALKYKPDFAIAYYNKGITLDELKQYSKAIAEYDKALKYQPDFKEAIYNKAVTLMHMGKHKEAVELYMGLWDDETVAKYKKALERGEHLDFNGQHVVIIPKREP